MATRLRIRSAAFEARIPGTFDLKARDGDATGYGQALFPVPSTDPNDPLQWSWAKKHSVLAICSFYSFLGCSSVFGVTPYLTLFSKLFNISVNDAAGLINFPALAYGFGSLLLVPLYNKIGRRPVLLGSMVIYISGLLGCSQANTFGGLMASRILQAFGSGICEAIPVQLVNDIFFLHQRGSKLGYCVIAINLAAASPVYAGYMLAGGYSWRLFFHINLAFAVALLIVTFFLVEETRYFRIKTSETSFPASPADSKGVIELIEESGSRSNPRRKSWTARLKLWDYVDHEYPYFITMARSFTYFLIPSNFWVITTYGIFIGFCALSYNFIFPIKIVASPYNWHETESGLIAITTIIGYALALPFSPCSDRLAAWLTKRNNMVREAEMRLGILLAPMILTPAALALFGVAAEKNWPWYIYFITASTIQWGAYFYFTIPLAYSMDAYNANLSELLISQNIGKTAVSFGAVYKVLEWIVENGYVKIISGWFAGVLLVNNLFVIVFMIWGKKFRIMTARGWLAKVHARTIVESQLPPNIN